MRDKEGSLEDAIVANGEAMDANNRLTKEKADLAKSLDEIKQAFKPIEEQNLAF